MKRNKMKINKYKIFNYYLLIRYIWNDIDNNITIIILN